MVTLTNDEYTFAGGSLMGEVLATRRELEEVFGSPTFDEWSPDGKVTVEWVLEHRNDDGSVLRVTVYDWKRYDLGTPGADEVYGWHVGGRSYECVLLVEQALSAIREMKG